MLNEIWPTVGWGSLEYGPPAGFTPGQVMGGRWKPLHYFYKQSLMTDVMATCGSTANPHGHPTAPDENQCYLSNMRASRSFSGTVTLTSYDHFGDGTAEVLLHRQVELPAGPGGIYWFGPPQGQALPPGNSTALMSTVRDEAGAVVSEHMVQLVTPQHICVPPATLSVSIGTRNASDGTIGISVTSDRVALWVRGRASCAVHWQQPWALEQALLHSHGAVVLVPVFAAVCR
jgi:beta-mannosidase